MKKILISVAVLLLIFFIGVLGLNAFFKNKITSFLDHSLSENIQLTYGTVKVNSLQGTISIKDVFLKLKKAGDSAYNTSIKSDEISLKNLSYWDYFINKQIHVSQIYLGKNSIDHIKNPSVDSTKSKKISPASLNKDIIIDRLSIGNTSLTINALKKDSTLLKLSNATLELETIKTDPELISHKIPFEFDQLSLKADSLFLRLNSFDNLTAGKIVLQEDRVDLQKINIKTQYSRAQLSKMIKKERDHINLAIPQATLNDIKWGFNQDTLFTTASVMQLSSPTLDLYRDKLVADDNTIKPLYSKMLRNTPFHIMLDSLKVNDAAIIYTERVNTKANPGKISFSKLNIRGAHIGNTYELGKQKTSLAIDGYFLDMAPLHVDWSFDINSPTDRFRFLASLGQLDAGKINSFTQPNLGAKMSGMVQQTYLDIDGNNTDSSINMKMNYSDFKVEILKKDSKKNWLVSAIANIFISKDSKDNDGGHFNTGEGKATRDQTKSFFNYLWLNVKSGLIKTLI